MNVMENLVEIRFTKTNRKPFFQRVDDRLKYK